MDSKDIIIFNITHFNLFPDVIYKSKNISDPFIIVATVNRRLNAMNTTSIITKEEMYSLISQDLVFEDMSKMPNLICYRNSDSNVEPAIEAVTCFMTDMLLEMKKPQIIIRMIDARDLNRCITFDSCELLIEIVLVQPNWYIIHGCTELNTKIYGKIHKDSVVSKIKEFIKDYIQESMITPEDLQVQLEKSKKIIDEQAKTIEELNARLNVLSEGINGLVSKIN